VPVDPQPATVMAAKVMTSTERLSMG
jgi:hypothetical protein